MKPLSILHTTCHTGWGGLEKRIFNESLWMQAQGHELTIAAPKGTPLYDRSKAHGFTTCPVEFGRLSFVGDYMRLMRIFNTQKPHVLNTHGNTDAKIALPAGKKAGIPCRILSRHISAHVRNTWYNKALYKHLSDYVFTTAHCTTRHLQTVFELDRDTVFSMPSGIIEPAHLPPKDAARNELAGNLGVRPDTRFIGFAGRVSRDKGVDLVLKAFGNIAGTIPHHLVIVGTGTDDYLSELHDLTAALNLSERVHFTGFTDNVWPFYRAFDLKILASRDINGVPFEGIPQALLEAMYADCPVIGAKSGGIVDIIRHEKTGLLFEMDDADSLSRTILDTMSQEERTWKMAGQARECVQTNHTIDAMGHATLDIYNQHFARD